MFDIRTSSIKSNQDILNLLFEDSNKIFHLHKAFQGKSAISENRQIKERYPSCKERRKYQISSNIKQKSPQRLKSLESESFENEDFKQNEYFVDKNDEKQPLTMDIILRKLLEKGSKKQSKFEQLQVNKDKQQYDHAQKRYQRAISQNNSTPKQQIDYFIKKNDLLLENHNVLRGTGFKQRNHSFDEKIYRKQKDHLYGVTKNDQIVNSICFTNNQAHMNRIRNQVRNVIDLSKLQQNTNTNIIHKEYSQDIAFKSQSNQQITQINSFPRNSMKSNLITKHRTQRKDSINSEADDILPAKYAQNALLTKNTQDINEPIAEYSSNLLNCQLPSNQPKDQVNQIDASGNLEKDENDEDDKSNFSANKTSSKKDPFNNQILEQKINNTSGQITYLSLIPPKDVSAKSWCLVDFEKRKMIEGKLCFVQREIASLTKLMTYCVCTHFFKQIKFDVKQTFLNINLIYTQVDGTNAQLEPHTWISVDDLLHGLLIPSGNDCAEIIADKIGAMIAIYKEKKEIPNEKRPLEQQINSIQNGRKFFIEYMNYLAKFIKMKNSCFTNPTGLPNSKNQSTAYDVGILSCLCMEFPEFRAIVRKKHFIATCLTEEGKSLPVTWKNTNQLLDKGFSGIKTGITNAAGPCLSSFIKLKDSSSGLKGQFVIVLLDCSSSEQRSEDSMILAKWAVKQLQFQ